MARAHKSHHLAVFPNIAIADPGTVRNLDDAIAHAEAKESVAT